MLRGLVLTVFTVAAGLSVWIQTEHYDQRDDAEALLRAQTHRFASTTRARLSTWLKATGHTEVRWRTERERFSDTTQVILELPETTATFSVDREGQVVPSDAAAERMVVQIIEHAKRPSAPPMNMRPQALSRP